KGRRWIEKGNNGVYYRGLISLPKVKRYKRWENSVNIFTALSKKKESSILDQLALANSTRR
ncbi:MAG: hypothetical protein ACE5K2_08390, partial [Candidatus Zixiibacteriota bacterium]